MQYHFHGTDGEPFADKTFHYRGDCEELDDPTRVIAESSIPDDADYCGACSPLGTASESDTCDVVKGDGEVCGRTLPCRYHS